MADIISSYSDDNNNRLIAIAPIDADSDDKRIAYLQLLAPNGDFTKDFPSDMSESKSIIEGVLVELKQKYQKFILTALGVSSQEKMQIMPTFGDAFAATFTGKDPTILSVTGHLVFDYAGSNSLSWYTAFLNAYEYFLRASRLSKWRAKIKLVLPDLVEYTGYMISLQTQFSADNDTIVSMQFSFLVTGQTVFKSLVEPVKATSTVPKSSTPTKIPVLTGQGVLNSIPAVNPNLEITPPLGFKSNAALFPRFTEVTKMLQPGGFDKILTSIAGSLIPTTVPTGSALSEVALMLSSKTKSFEKSLVSIFEANGPAAEKLGKEYIEAGKPFIGALDAKLKSYGVRLK